MRLYVFLNYARWAAPTLALVICAMGLYVLQFVGPMPMFANWLTVGVLLALFGIWLAGLHVVDDIFSGLWGTLLMGMSLCIGLACLLIGTVMLLVR